MLDVYIKHIIYLVLIVIIIILFYSCYHNRMKTKHECFQHTKLYEIPNQLTAHKAKALVFTVIIFCILFSATKIGN